MYEQANMHACYACMQLAHFNMLYTCMLYVYYYCQASVWCCQDSDRCMSVHHRSVHHTSVHHASVHHASVYQFVHQHHLLFVCADPSDYIGGVITVTFQPGERARMVTFAVTDDEYAECPERFLAHLGIPEPSKGLGVVRGEPHTVTVDIGDNDGVICSVDESDSTVTVDEGVGAVHISVSCSGISSNMFMVQMQTTDNSTTGGSCDSHMTMMQLSHIYHVTVTWMYLTVGGLDYKNGPYDIEFEPGEMKKTVQVSIDDDTEPEVTESFFVSISVPEAFTECGVSALSSPRQIQIADNDAILVEFDPVEYRVGEAGGVVELTLVTSSVVIRDGMVTIQTNSGNATGLPSVAVCCVQ